ncbi:hypothetical protein CERZMDRAFT_101861 [Cercospora zeae-maydis SCOH1-5]|uniref:Uncharacterized protein n=1 Tax=Cercospora zeae-maydis SCOH1-5 TaxID=717836 RepID=A0A6A6F401_9PEZI|nr:hypothetical protein CERZMDRAFT_101861 [Cercospora zeae-maydis SCOH1-5]
MSIYEELKAVGGAVFGADGSPVFIHTDNNGNYHLRLLNNDHATQTVLQVMTVDAVAVSTTVRKGTPYSVQEAIANMLQSQIPVGLHIYIRHVFERIVRAYHTLNPSCASRNHGCFLGEVDDAGIMDVDDIPPSSRSGPVTQSISGKSKALTGGHKGIGWNMHGLCTAFTCGINAKSQQPRERGWPARPMLALLYLEVF